MRHTIESIQISIEYGEYRQATQTAVRYITAMLLVIPMRLTGYRFGPGHRRNETWQYRWIDTVAANWAAGMDI